MTVDLLDILRDPEKLTTTNPSQQSQIIRQANHAALLGYLEARLNKGQLNPKLADTMNGAKVHSDYYSNQMSWETHCVEDILGGMEGPVVLLKGAAYRALDLGLAKGRLASDVDLLLPKEQLEIAEMLLKDAGWEAMKSDEYEEHYYREWMHELPPLQHRERGTIIDLHHNILPPTARFKPDAGKLIEASVQIEGSTLYTLSPVDTLLHRCAHLFIDGDMHNSLRELVDVNELLSLYLNQESFKQSLVARARELDLSLALYYALYFCRKLLKNEFPTEWLENLSTELSTASKLTRTLMETLLTAVNPGESTLKYRASSWLLYMRSHWLRMPPIMLVKHLARQAWNRGGLKSGS